MELYPLTFEPELKDKIWGGRRLEEFLGKPLPGDLPVGESWEVHGGSVVASGPYGGRTLDDLRAELGAALVGRVASGHPENIFPLLFKYIDASDVLSVQVHPDDAYAREHEGYPLGKTESWYIVHADAGAKLVHGWKRPTRREEVAEAVRESRLEDLLEYVEVSVGDVVFVPAGTVHAIGGGIVLGEIQENSDITYRLYDWGRVGFDGRPRELHVERSLDVLDYGATPVHRTKPVTHYLDGVTRSFRVGCGYFVMESLEGSRAARVEGGDSSFRIVSSLEGPVGLSWPGGETRLERGRTAVLPAALTEWGLDPEDSHYRVLVMYVPSGRGADPKLPLGPEASDLEVKPQ